MDTEGVIGCIKAEDVYADITKDIETRFNTSNYEVDKPLPRRKIKELLN